MLIQIQIEVKTDSLRLLWLKKVHGFDPAVHCAKCLLGSYVKGIPFRGTKKGFALNTEIDMEGSPYLYLCGVAGRYASNAHIPLLAEEGASTQYDDEDLRVRVRNGFLLLPIPELPAEVKAGLTAAFHTCRNYRFGWHQFPQDRAE